MTFARRGFKRPRRDWLWRVRKNGPPAVIERQDTGPWTIANDGRIAGAATREVAILTVDQLDNIENKGANQ
jgi:hypothetical protein